MTLSMPIFKKIISSLTWSKVLLPFFVLACLGACGNSGVNVIAEFESAQGVKEGTKVYFEGRRVGQVVEVDDENSKWLITIEIDQKAASTIDSQAAVVINRIKPGTPLEIYASALADNLSLQGGLQEGQQLHALNSMFELIAWSLGDAIQVSTGELSGYVDSFQDYLEGAQFQENRALVEARVLEMASIASDTLKIVEQDLAKAMSEVSVSEEELADAINQLGDELSPIAEEMAKSGTDLKHELERFVQGLETATAEEQASGQKLIQSLIEIIEKLNDAAENGVERSVQAAD